MRQGGTPLWTREEGYGWWEVGRLEKYLTDQVSQVGT